MTARQHRLLIVFSGLPGIGKTTVAKLLAPRLGAVFLRIDTIEQSMKAAGAVQIGAAGYAVANALAAENLQLDHSIVADCVNPVRDSRLGWETVAEQTSAILINIYLVCSDLAEHRRRVAGRTADIPGLVVPSWDQVMRHEFEPHDDADLVLDTAALQAQDLADRCETDIKRLSASKSGCFSSRARSGLGQ